MDFSYLTHKGLLNYIKNILHSLEISPENIYTKIEIYYSFTQLC